VRETERVATSTTETVFESMFGTQSSPRITTEARGFSPTGTDAVIWSVCGSSRYTLFVSLEIHSASAVGVIQSACSSFSFAVMRFRAGSMRRTRPSR